jgi:hypothetical protein
MVRMIDAVFPWAASGSPKHQAQWHMLQDLNAVLSLVDKLPDSMLRLSSEQFTDFLWAQSALRSMVRLLETGQLSAVGGVSWPMVRNHNALATLRGLLSDCPDETVSENVSALSFLKDAELIEDIRLDISSAEASFNGGEWKPATVMAGAALESLLLWAVLRYTEADRASAIKAQQLGNLDAAHPESPAWGLAKYIPVAEHLKAISASTAQQARLAQDFRNLIHPGRQIRLQMKCDRGAVCSCSCRSRNSGLESEPISRPEKLFPTLPALSKAGTILIPNPERRTILRFALAPVV